MSNMFYLIYYTSWYDRSVGSSQFVREQSAKSNIQTYYSHFLNEVRLLLINMCYFVFACLFSEKRI